MGGLSLTAGVVEAFASDHAAPQATGLLPRFRIAGVAQ
jgi:hypothetical protein